MRPRDKTGPPTRRNWGAEIDNENSGTRLAASTLEAFALGTAAPQLTGPYSRTALPEVGHATSESAAWLIRVRAFVPVRCAILAAESTRSANPIRSAAALPIALWGAIRALHAAVARFCLALLVRVVSQLAHRHVKDLGVPDALVQQQALDEPSEPSQGSSGPIANRLHVREEFRIRHCLGTVASRVASVVLVARRREGRHPKWSLRNGIESVLRPAAVDVWLEVQFRNGLGASLLIEGPYAWTSGIGRAS